MTPKHAQPLPAYANGRFEPFVQDDFITGVVIDGWSSLPIDDRLDGEDRLTFKIQLAGAGEYLFDQAPGSRVDGECLVIAHQPKGTMKRQIIAADTAERSVTLFLPRLESGRIAGFEDDSQEVRAACAYLSKRLVFQKHLLPRAAAQSVEAILEMRRSPWAQERFKRAKIDELTCLVLDFFFSQFKQVQDHGLSEREVRRVREAREIISARLDAPMSLADLSRSVGLNRTRLNTAFRAVYGQTISQVLQKERMEAARAMLCSDDISVTEIAERCGYGHLSNFSLAYKAYFGISPSIVRDGAAQIVRPT
jgi:AraC-like DNA-binding protein